MKLTCLKIKVGIQRYLGCRNSITSMFASRGSVSTPAMFRSSSLNCFIAFFLSLGVNQFRPSLRMHGWATNASNLHTCYEHQSDVFSSWMECTLNVRLQFHTSRAALFHFLSSRRLSRTTDWYMYVIWFRSGSCRLLHPEDCKREDLSACANVCMANVSVIDSCTQTAIKINACAFIYNWHIHVITWMNARHACACLASQ